MLAVLYCAVAIAAASPLGFEPQPPGTSELLPDRAFDGRTVSGLDHRVAEALGRLRSEQERDLQILRNEIDARLGDLQQGRLERSELERELEDLQTQLAIQGRVLWSTIAALGAWLAYFTFRLWQLQRPRRRLPQRAIRGLPLVPSPDR